MSEETTSESLEKILAHYKHAFSTKSFIQETTAEDDLMLIFGLTQETKSHNKQYWGRELGMCWQRIIVELCRQTSRHFGEAVRDKTNELCDLVVENDAIDTKYRVGSGDSGTLKKFKQYGTTLCQSGYRPILLVLRDDNLPAAITACKAGGWHVLTSGDSYTYIHRITGFDLRSWLQAQRYQYNIHR